ncbi:epoxyqueuosine reductase [Rhizobiales bacterium GAS191]|nr:epoxyqueuosine reductase [Rhizobiales bacterium GAS113]SED89226.1 epoxyqueuosine reductase [Rhizobiales bacterium GAS191]SEE57052.1 epoxyqueuosine reductase [Rhizobiales bacterium GAS188]
MMHAPDVNAPDLDAPDLPPPAGPGIVARPQTKTDPAMLLRSRLEQRARRLGFTSFGVTSPAASPELEARLGTWLAAGEHGGMGWMARDPQRRASPQALWGEVRSIIMLGLDAPPLSDPLAALSRRDAGLVAAYARRRDYHDVIKGRLKELAQTLVALAGAEVKVFVDTAPVMEKPLAAAAGLGWQGKHTVLLSRETGNWLLLGSIFTTAQLPLDEPGTDHCGTCRRCLDICPTKAFPAPYRLDARRCIAYLTIEHKGPIPREFREAIGNRVFGCDDCLAICPWNKYAKASHDTRMAERGELAARPLRELARLDDSAFRKLFAGTPIKRTGRDRFLRNVLIAIGNSGDSELADEAVRLLDDPSPLVRGMAVWAASRLLPQARFAALARRCRAHEIDAQVLAEYAEGEATT